MNRKAFFIGSGIAAVLLAAIAVVGVVRAQSPSPAGPGANGQAQSGHRGALLDGFLNALAQNLGISRPTLDNALKTTAKQQIDQAVAAGRIPQDRADQIKQRIDSGQFPFGPGGMGFGRGGEGFGAMRACRSSAEQAVTSTLGVSASDLRQARQNGQTLDQIAQQHGKTAQDVRTAVSGAMKSCLDQQVQQGKLTSDQEQRILDRIANGPAGFGPGGRGPGGHRSSQSGNS
jgi:uncharacterized protein YidB (DUF937 family)